MDELQYRDTYHHVNPQRCHFEKSINARASNCCHMRRFNLADREGVRCTHEIAGKRCAEWLHRLRHATRFALAADNPDALPHRLEAKVQSGGLQGLAGLLKQDSGPQNIAALLEAAIQRYDEVEQIPWDDVTEAVRNYEPRRRRTRSQSGTTSQRRGTAASNSRV